MIRKGMAPEGERDLPLEIGHVLFVDIVGYSKLLINEQTELLQHLKEMVRESAQIRAADAAGKLIRLATGDGMALVFRTSPEAPAQCALELSRADKQHPELRLRMGIHSGPINEVVDVNERVNVTGAGINTAQRVMDCGDAGHILLSQHVADDLEQFPRWRPLLHELGECEVKHAVRLRVVNLYNEELGNPERPLKFQGTTVPPVAAAGSGWNRRMTGLVLAAALSLGGLAWWFAVRPGEPRLQPVTAPVIPAISEKSIAVLPFENLSNDKENAYFADGVQDEILANLAKIADLKVISRTSVMQYKSDGRRNLREIAQQLGVAHVLEGSVQRAAHRVRINAQLIDARNDSHLWAQTYDRDLADVFAIQSEIAEKIVAQLKAQLSPQEKAAIEEESTANPLAHDLYIKATALLSASSFNLQGTQNLFEAADLLEKAVATDPDYFRAYCRLASVHDQIYLTGPDRTPARLALADAAVKNAQRLRPDAGETHLALAEHLYCGSLDHDRARQELELARRTLPNEPLVFQLAGFIDRRQGRWDESTRNLLRALELDPRNAYTLQQIAVSYQMMRRFNDAAAMIDRTLAILPDDPSLRVERAALDLHAFAESRAMHKTVHDIVTNDRTAASGIADEWLYLALCERDLDFAEQSITVMPTDGYTNEGILLPRDWCEGLVARTGSDLAAAQAAFGAARTRLEETLRQNPNQPETLCVLAMINAALGRKDEAIREGRRAVELLPLDKDAINGALAIEYLAVTYAWAAEKDQAIEQLKHAAAIPDDVSYGQLRLHPFWDSLRGDPRFEQIVASLAPASEQH